jgi:tRNA G18 (ribose-2'-O)-methylase SpoU
VVRIDGPDDPRAAAFRDVADDARLRQRGLFVAEGRLVVERLIGDRRFELRSLLLNGSASRALEAAVLQLGEDVTALVCESPDFKALTGYNIHRGCLALASRPAPTPLEDILSSARLLLVLEGVSNADNVGGIFRNAAAFGVGGVVLSYGCADPLYRKSIRTSMAATLRVPFCSLVASDGWPDALARIRASGFQILALTPAVSAQGLDDFVRSSHCERIALLLGAEGAGLSRMSEAAADVHVRIPIRRDVDSLNVAVAAGIALHRLAPRISEPPSRQQQE